MATDDDDDDDGDDDVDAFCMNTEQMECSCPHVGAVSVSSVGKLLFAFFDPLHRISTIERNATSCEHLAKPELQGTLSTEPRKEVATALHPQSTLQRKRSGNHHATAEHSLRKVRSGNRTATIEHLATQSTATTEHLAAQSTAHLEGTALSNANFAIEWTGNFWNLQTL